MDQTPSDSAASRESRPRRSSSFPILVFILCFLFGLWIIPWVAQPISYAINRGKENAKADAAKKLFLELNEAGVSIPMSTIVPWVVKKVGPTVVGIETLSSQQVPVANTEYGARGRARMVPEFIYEGKGSGVIVDKEGYILTNYHVIAGANEINIRFSDGRKIGGVRLVGFDRTTDLAVLKIETMNLEVMPWGDSDATQVGEPVLAIGNPFGLSHTVTQGIISAKERYNAIPDSRMVQEFLQTDAAINPGNSGGPLVNTQGELIGINTAIYGETYQGIGFAIPSVLAKNVYEQIRKSQGELIHGYLGVYLEPLSESFARQNGLEDEKGAVIQLIGSNSPAEKAGLRANDIITKWGETPVINHTHLTHLVILTPPETQLTVTIVRKGETLEIPVTVGIRPSM